MLQDQGGDRCRVLEVTLLITVILQEGGGVQLKSQHLKRRDRQISVSSRSTEFVIGQPGLYKESLSQNKNKLIRILILNQE